MAPTTRSRGKQQEARSDGKAASARKDSGGAKQASASRKTSTARNNKDNPARKDAPVRRRSVQRIDSVDQHEERPGRTLLTQNHDVIRQWAEARDGRPATVVGTLHDGRPGVLRFDFGQPTRRLEAVSWDEWFGTFDARNLNFIYQEHKRDGSDSNFFRLENPDREDA